MTEVQEPPRVWWGGREPAQLQTVYPVVAKGHNRAQEAAPVGLRSRPGMQSTCSPGASHTSRPGEARWFTAFLDMQVHQPCSHLTQPCAWQSMMRAPRAPGALLSPLQGCLGRGDRSSLGNLPTSAKGLAFCSHTKRPKVGGGASKESTVWMTD